MKKREKKYEKLIFDLDDTLMDNRENVKYAFRKLLKQRGEFYTDTKFEEFYKLENSFWKAWQKKEIIVPDEYNTSIEKRKNWLRARRFQLYYKEKIKLEEAKKLNDLYIEYLKDKVIPVKDAHKVIKELAKDYEIIVATNGPVLALEEKIQKLQIRQYVTQTFSAEEIGKMKPDKAFYLGIMKKIHYHKKDKMLVIGDSLLSDIKGANDMGIDCIWFNAKQETIEEGYSPNKVITQLTQLLSLL